jgi:hypothetical protein
MRIVSVINTQPYSLNQEVPPLFLQPNKPNLYKWLYLLFVIKHRMKNYTLTGGLTIGFVTILVTLISYFIGVGAMTSIITRFILFAVCTALFLYFGYQYRKANGGFLPFREAFALMFFISVISSVMSGFFNILLTHVINPGLPQKLQEASIQKLIDLYTLLGFPKDKIDEQVAVLQALPTTVSIAQELKGIVFGFIGSAILALILGAIIKKNPPPFDNITDQSTQ